MIIAVLIILIPVIAAYLFTQLQIKEMRNIEKEKRIIAIQSLVLELEYNKNLVTNYIKNCKDGGHLGNPDNRDCTWEIVSPNFENYRYLALACHSDIRLAREITIIYSRLEECRILINQIQQIWSNNLVIKETVINGGELLKQEIFKHNGYLLNSSNKIVSLFDSSIVKLDTIKDSIKIKKWLS